MSLDQLNLWPTCATEGAADMLPDYCRTTEMTNAVSRCALLREVLTEQAEELGIIVGDMTCPKVIAQEISAAQAEETEGVYYAA